MSDISIDQEKVKEYQDIIKRILEAFGKIPFYVILESTMGVKVEPYNASNIKDKALVGGFSKVADMLTETYYSSNIDEELYRRVKKHPPKNFRNNEATQERTP